MPIIKSAAKRVRQTTTRTRRNNTYRRQMRDAIKSFRAAVAEKDKKAATTGLTKSQQAIDKAVKHNIMHRNTASRRKSGLSKEFDAAFDSKATTTKKKAAPTSTAKKTPAKKPAAKKTAAKKPAAKKSATTAKKPAAKKSTSTTKKTTKK